MVLRSLLLAACKDSFVLLVVAVVVDGDTGGEFMLVVVEGVYRRVFKRGLEDSVQVGIGLVGIPQARAVAVGLAVVRSRRNHAHGHTRRLVEYIPVLHKSVYPPRA